MKDVIAYLIDLFGSFSPKTQVVLVLLVGGLLFFGYHFVKNESFRKSMILLVRKAFKGVTSGVHLLSHDLFFKKRYLIDLANHVSFTSDNKTKLFHILLQKKIEASVDITQKFIKTFDYTKNDKELFACLYDNMLNIIESYETRIQSEFMLMYGLDKGKQLFDLVYHKKDIGFKTVHDVNVLFIVKNIEKMSLSNAFSVKQKVHHYLTQIEIALELAVIDCETAFESLNGNIDQIVMS